MKHFIKVVLLGIILAAGEGLPSMATAGGDTETQVFDLTTVLVRFKVWVLGVIPVSGQFHSVKGSLVRDNGPDTASVNMTVDAASIDTENSFRDALLRGEKFFDVNQYPEVSFEVREFDVTGPFNGKLTGQLMLRGMKRDVVFDIAPNHGGYTASAVISRSDFGMKEMPLAVSDDVHVQIMLPNLKI